MEELIMTYEVILEKCGKTVTKIVEDVNGEEEAKLKALFETMLTNGNGFNVSSTKLLVG